uniref:zinc finger protein 69 homolog B-like n=1 Tax=Halichoerus grypus TaxID=9711 RepID=UPI0016599A54|nr:zinc finger protein 69 homolog B-like [Halichoerus grypus]XP_035926232.1 zinc finger protein 69 homolog B-like [Halichoerus grypus]
MATFVFTSCVLDTLSRKGDHDPVTGSSDIQRCCCGLYQGRVKPAKMNPPQRNLYREVMLENNKSLVSVGCQPFEDNVISRLDLEEETWMMRRAPL